MIKQSEIIELDTEIQIALQHARQMHRDNRSNGLYCAIASLEESLESLDKLKIKVVRNHDRRYISNRNIA